MSIGSMSGFVIAHAASATRSMSELLLPAVDTACVSSISGLGTRKILTVLQ